MAKCSLLLAVVLLVMAIGMEKGVGKRNVERAGYLMSHLRGGGTPRRLDNVRENELRRQRQSMNRMRGARAAGLRYGRMDIENERKHRLRGDQERKANKWNTKRRDSNKIRERRQREEPESKLRWRNRWKAHHSHNRRHRRNIRENGNHWEPRFRRNTARDEINEDIKNKNRKGNKEAKRGKGESNIYKSTKSGPVKKRNKAPKQTTQKTSHNLKKKTKSKKKQLKKQNSPDNASKGKTKEDNKTGKKRILNQTKKEQGEGKKTKKYSGGRALAAKKNGKNKGTKKKSKEKPTKNKAFKIWKVSVSLGNGVDAAAGVGKCKISKVLPVDDGNGVVFFGNAVLKGGICQYNFKAPEGKTLSVNCPVFNLHQKGCSSEELTLGNNGENSTYCTSSAPKSWISSTNNLDIFHKRSSTKKKDRATCSFGFVCKISVTDTAEKDKFIGYDSDCGQTFNLEAGESAVVFSTNGLAQRKCKHNFRGPKGTIFNITCPLVDLYSKRTCGESLEVKDTGHSYRQDKLCAYKRYKRLDIHRTVAHTLEFEHGRRKSKKGCSAGFLCKVTVLAWWNKAEAVQGFDIPGYKTTVGPYPFKHTACPPISSLSDDNKNCEFRCSKDEDCPPLHYCCPTGCGRICVPPQILTEDDCGCSVSFIKKIYFDVHDNNFDYLQYNYVVDLRIDNFVWEAIRESFVPDLEPYIIEGLFEDVRLGPQDSLCSLKRKIESGGNITEYGAFKKPKRILFIISDDSEFFDEIAVAPLAASFTSICAVTVGNITLGETLLNQLTGISNEPCVWNVHSYRSLKDALPNVKSFINNGSCVCGGETVPSSPCLGAGEACSRDRDCDQPTLLCNKGICTPKQCAVPKIFSPEIEDNFDYLSYYDYDYTYYNESFTGYYHDYDYFYDLLSTSVQDSKRWTKYNNKLKDQSRISQHSVVTLSNSSHSDWKKDHSKYVWKSTSRLTLYGSMGSQCCPLGSLQCSGTPTLCVEDLYVCDGIDDCFNGDDETSEACAKRQCGDGWFQCDNGKCISKKMKCDGVKDCSDGSDESCLKQSDCPSTRQHHCSSGECISHRNICDGYLDCRSGEDERPCKCKGFRCRSGGCVGYWSVCDGIKNCLDGSDEECGLTTCPSERPFRCGNGACIGEILKCDGWKFCSDGSDEAPELCSPQSCFYCDGGKCLSNSTVCDGFRNCADGSDETNCKDFVCGKGKFHCTSGECLSDSFQCNNREECVDGSDESSCNAITCPDSRPLFCSSGECIDYTQVCDGKYDCADRSDESKCQGLLCPVERENKCLFGQCMTSEITYCNGRSDCLDGSDELNCQTIECVNNGHECKSGECVQNWQVCNGYRDCEDGSDEEDCANAPCDFVTIAGFRCNSGECIPYNFRCDGSPHCYDESDEDCQNNDCFKCSSGVCSKNSACDGIFGCQDGSDEKNCGDLVKCQELEKKCNSGECVYKFRYCDGYSNCFDNSDETNCQNFACPVQRPLQCKSGECRRGFERCNGFTSCADGSDEADCQSFICPSNRPFSCPSGNCITTYQLCNGIDDCGDGSDERNCSSIKCLQNDFKCKKGNCIPLRYRCDDDPDCDDGEDELDCKKLKRQCGKKFRCDADNKCIPNYFVCDGVKACSDGADEKNC